MPEDHDVCGRAEELALSVRGAAAPAGDAQQLVASGPGAAAAGELARLARELGLGACIHSTDALKAELQKIVLALHPDKSGGEFTSDGDKARFMKARRAIELLNGDRAADARGASTPLAGAARAITDTTSAPATSLENEHRLQVLLLADARTRIARYFAAPKIASSVLATVSLALVLAADLFQGHPLLGPLMSEAAVLIFLSVLGFAAAALSAALWFSERAAVAHAEHLLSESALGKLFERARRSARRQGRVSQLSAFDIRRAIDALADESGTGRALRGRRLLGRSLDARTRESITLIQTQRLLARRVIRVMDRPALEVLYEISPRAMAEAMH